MRLTSAPSQGPVLAALSKGAIVSLIQTLSRFALAPITASPTAEQMIRLSCLDWAACALAGRDEPVAQHLRAIALAEGGRSDAHLIGANLVEKGRVPARAAALVNGATSHALDYDDTHFAHIGHPSVAIFPAVFAIAERTGASFADALDAALIGAETSIRVGLWLGRAHYQTGFHQTATAGAFGAVAAVARLQGLDHETTQHAFALASTKAAGLKSQFGTMGKPLNAGLAAECGVMAVDWAVAGLRSDTRALDGLNGFGPTHHGAADMTAFDGLGADWLFEDVSHKFHACCHGLHAMLEALRDVASPPKHLQITTHPRWMTVCNIEAPKTGLEAKFSYKMTAAMALLGVDTGAIASFSDAVAARGDLADIMARITVIADDRLSETQARLDVNGALLHHDLGAPIPLDTRETRLKTKAASLTPQADALWSAIQSGDRTAFNAVLFA